MPHPLVRLYRYSAPHQRQVLSAIACSILNKIFDLAPPVLIGMAVDVVVQRQDSWLAKWGVVPVDQQLGLLVLFSFVIWSLESLFEYLYAWQWRTLAQTLQHELRLDAYGHLQELELSFFEERSTGQLLSVLNDDINQLERFLDHGANEILQVTTTVLAVGGAMAYLSPTVAGLAILPIPVILWGSLRFQRRLAPRYARVREQAGLISARLANNLGGIATIKSFTAEAFEKGRVAEDSDAYRQANRRAIALSSAFVPLIRFAILFAFIAILYVGGMETINGRLDVGTYSFLVFITQRLLWPLTSLGRVLDDYQRAMASTQRVMDLLAIPVQIPSGRQSLPIGQVQGSVRFENLTFAYRDRAPSVIDLNLEIPAGQTIAIVGATGSGKSTLVKLLLRFYEPQTGRIYLDGIDLRDLKLKDLRQAIGFVSQDVFLFHGSVAENIAYGSFEATQTEIEQAAKLAEAHEFIMDLPQGYDTIVGERGQKLSGGQRQRLAIARAILKDPPILILDEATSAVDNETEAAIQRSLEQITRDRTTLAIAHRLSTIRHADCIYVMDQGRLVEAGHHDDLIALDGLYANLWKVQTGERLSDRV